MSSSTVSFYTPFHAATVAEFSVLDLDQRSIAARAGLRTETSLQEAKQIYQTGRSSQQDSSLSLQGLLLQDDSSLLRNSPTNWSSISVSGMNENMNVLAALASFYDDTTTISQVGDAWILAALDGINLDCADSGCQVRFGTTTDFLAGRSGAVPTAVLLWSVWTSILAFLLQAQSIVCDSSDSSNNNQVAMEAWDKAFSLYTGSSAAGSLEDPVVGGGYFIYGWIQTEAEEFFGTTVLGQEAPVNKELMQRFVQGRDWIAATASGNNDCSTFSQHVQRMMSLLQVPIVQGALRNLYAMDLQDDPRLMIKGETAALGSVLAPLMSVCSSGSADLVYQDMVTNSFLEEKVGSFEVIQSALQNQYECLGITCQDVGGLWNTQRNGYLPRAEACGGVSPVDVTSTVEADNSSSSSPSFNTSPITKKDDDKNKIALGVGLGLGLPLCIALVFGIAYYFRRRRRRMDQDDAIASAAIEIETRSPEEKSSSPDDDHEIDTVVQACDCCGDDDGELKIEDGEFS